MSIDRRKAAIAFSVFILIAFTALLVWRASEWRDFGWAGLGYYGPPRPEIDTSANFGMFTRKPRQVIAVVPGSPAAAAGIRPGDEIQTINGIQLDQTPRLRELEKKTRVGDPVTYSLKRAGKPLIARVVMGSPLDSRYLVLNAVASIFTGLVFLAISLLVFWMKPRSRRAVVFYWMCVVGASFFLLSGPAQVDASGVTGISPAEENIRPFFVLLVYTILALTLTNLLLHLALIFPKERPVVEKFPGIIAWIYTLSFFPIFAVTVFFLGLSLPRQTFAPFLLIGSLLAIIAAAVLFLSRRRRAESATWTAAIIRHPFVTQGALVAGMSLLAPVLKVAQAPRSVMVGLIFLVFIGMGLALCAIVIVYSVLTAMALFRSYRGSNVEEKRQLRWPLWGTIVALGVIVVIVSAELLLFELKPKFAYEHFTLAAAVSVLVRLCYLLIPVSFAFGILKYRLMDIDVIIKKTLVYTSITGFIIVSYLILVAMMGATLVRFTGVRSQTVTIISTLAIAALFVPVRNRVQTFVDRRFFRRKYDYPQALRLLSHEVSRAHDLDKLLGTAAEVLQQALQNRFVVIFAEGREPERLVPVARIGVPDDAVAGLSLEKRTFRNAEMMRSVAAADLEPRGLPAEIEVVMKAKGEVLGVARFGPKLDHEQFDDEDREFLRSVTDQIALGIDSLRVRREQQEFAQALDIQRALLPKEPPVIRGLALSSWWQPARTVGGDYFDLLKFDDSTVGLCIGDVAGKGMPAALLMSSLQAAVRAIASADTSPAEVCTKVRKVVCSNLSGGKFVTFFYGMVDSERKRLWYVNAGHNPPILLRSDGTVRRLTEGGPAFARLLSGTPYQQGDLALASGDRLILFTDGVSEALSPNEVEFGEDRVATVVKGASSAPAHQLYQAVHDFTSGELQDDVTIVSMTVS